MDTTPARYHDFWWVLYLTGFRRNEAFQRQWKHVDLRSRIILFHSTQNKEAEFKRVPIHRDLIPVLERIGKVRTLGSDSLWLWGYHAPSDPWKSAMAKLKWADPRSRINDLRHTWKSNARRSGIDEEVREKIMGHAGRKKNVA